MWQTGTIRVAKVGGIAVELHFSFFLVIVFGAWQGWSQYGGLLGSAYGLLLNALLFGCILLHELGHGLQARALGLVVKRIILLPIGGVAILESPPIYAWHELLYTLAGPIVNLGLAMFFGIAAYILVPLETGSLTDQLLMVFFLPPSLSGVLLYLVSANLILFAFNMLPAFPMDGGSVLRATLAMLMRYETATLITAWLSCLQAAALIGLGGFGWLFWPLTLNPLLIIMGIVILVGTWHAEDLVRRRRALVRVEVHEVTQRNGEILAPWDTITAHLVARLFRHDSTLPVIVEGRVIGLLTYRDVQRAYRRSHSDTLTVAHVMRTHFPVVRLRDTLWVALQEMNAFQLAALPVVDQDVYHGIVRLDDINSHAWRFAFRRRRPTTTLVSGERPIYD